MMHKFGENLVSRRAVIPEKKGRKIGLSGIQTGVYDLVENTTIGNRTDKSFWREITRRKPTSPIRKNLTNLQTVTKRSVSPEYWFSSQVKEAQKTISDKWTSSFKMCLTPPTKQPFATFTSYSILLSRHSLGGTVAVYSTVCPRSTDDWESIVVIDNTIFLFQGIWLIQDGKVRPGTLSTMATIIID